MDSDERGLDSILLEMEKNGASDVYITEDREVSYKIEGRIEKTDLYMSKSDVQLAIERLTGGKAGLVDIYEPAEKDGSYALYDGEKLRHYRYNAALADGYLHVTVRKLISEPPSLEYVLLHEGKGKEFLERFLGEEEGIYLISGATRSGKSTTAVAMLHTLLLERSVKTVTLEEPIEFRFDPLLYPKSEIIQREVGRDTKSFYEGLRAAMRQSPDYIFVGEIRDAKTAEAAIAASLTGHVVLGTVHASGVEETYSRMRRLAGEAAEDLRWTLKGVAFQRLGVDPQGRLKLHREIKIIDES